MEIQSRFAAAFLHAMHIFHKMVGRVIKTGDIPLAQYRLLMLLHARGPLTINQLKSLLNVAQSTASELCLRTERAGFVQKCADSSDKRRSLYQLSAQGSALLKKRRREMNKIYQNALQGLSPEQQEELVKAFETISKLLDID